MKYHEAANQRVYVCDWCNQRITANPFTRLINEELFMFCSQEHMTAHDTYCRTHSEYQSRFNFDVVR